MQIEMRELFPIFSVFLVRAPITGSVNNIPGVWWDDGGGGESNVLCAHVDIAFRQSGFHITFGLLIFVVFSSLRIPP